MMQVSVAFAHWLIVLIVLIGAIQPSRTTFNGTAQLNFDSDRNQTLTGHLKPRDSVGGSFSVGVDSFLSSSSILYGLVGQSSPQEVNRTCHDQLQSIYDGIHRRDIWAMKMLDASATAQPGFVWGNNFWLGSRKQCESIQEPKHITLSSRFRRNMKESLVDAPAPFPVNYRVIYAKHSSPWQIEVEFLLTAKILHLGVCVPVSCENSDLERLSQSYLDSSLMESQNMFVHQAQVVQVKDLELPDDFLSKTSIKIVGTFLLFTAMMVLLAAFYDYGNESVRKSLPNIFQNLSNGNNERNFGTKVDKYVEILANRSNLPSVINDHIQVPQIKVNSSDSEVELPLFERLVRCFSLRANLKSVLSTYSPPSAVPTINAFKAIGCIQIMNFHLVWFSYYTVNNAAEVFVMGEKLHWQWLSTAPLIVDIFFAISGLLLAYNFLRNQKKCDEIRSNSLWQNTKLFGRQFLHRYLRLTPLYLTVVGGTEITTSYLAAKSPFWIVDRTDLSCQRNWWRNVLYIQNFFAVDEICVNWTWSLACEMQFFLLCSVLLFVYVKYPVAAKNIFLGMFAGFTVLMAVISWQVKFTPAYDVMHNLGMELYTTPWVRVLPYLIGLAVGWYLQTSQGDPLPLTQKSVKLLWTMTITIMVMCHMVTFIRNISYELAVPMIVALRLFYASSACWMIVATVKGHGGWFASFTGFPFFVHLNKLSYGIYLLNPIVISFIYGVGDHSTPAEPIIQVTTALGVMVIVYIMAFAFSLLFEVPYTKLSAEILRGRRKVKTT